MVDIPPVFLCFYCSSFFSGALQLSFCFVFVFSFVFTPLCTQDPSCVSFSWTGRRGTLTFTTTACRISRRWALTISAWTAGWPATTKTRRMRAGLTQITKRTNHSTASGCRPLAVPLSQSCQRRLAYAHTFTLMHAYQFQNIDGYLSWPKTYGHVHPSQWWWTAWHLHTLTRLLRRHPSQLPRSAQSQLCAKRKTAEVKPARKYIFILSIRCQHTLVMHALPAASARSAWQWVYMANHVEFMLSKNNNIQSICKCKKQTLLSPSVRCWNYNITDH